MTRTITTTEPAQAAAAERSPAVSAAGLTKRYGAGVSAVEALRGVSLEVRAIADRILFLDDGLIVQEFGKSDEHRVLSVMEELGR
jgi:hypothetical protein